MSGDPTFDRAKRFKHLHTSHKTVFNGSETVHAKTNLTASIDGDYEVKADKILFDVDNASFDGDLDIKHNKLINPKNILRTEKITITHTDLTATGIAQAVNLFRASPGDSVANQTANLTASFGASGAVERTKVEVGDAGDTNGFGTEIVLATPNEWKWMTEDYTEKGAYFYNASRDRIWKNYSAATLINAQFTASNMFLASLGHGSIDFYIDVMSRA